MASSSSSSSSPAFSPPPVGEGGDSSYERQDNIPFWVVEKNLTTVCVPTYLSMVVKRMEKFNFVDASIVFNLTLVLRVLVRGLPEDLIEFIKEKVKMRLNEKDEISFDKESSEVKRDKDVVVFTLRLSPEITFAPKIRNFPFDTQNISMRFELTSTRFHERNWHVRYNFHTNLAPNAAMNFKQVKMLDAVPDFNVAYGIVKAPQILLERKITPDKPSTSSGKKPSAEESLALMQPEVVKKEDGLRYFPVITFKIPLYREPGFVLLNSIAPLIILNIMALCIFILEVDDFPSRLSAIITLLLALVAFMPTYRSQIPNIPEITQLDSAMAISVLVIFLTTIDSIMGSYEGDIPRLRWSLFGIALALVIFVFATFIVEWFMYLSNKELYDNGPWRPKDLIVSGEDKKQRNAILDHLIRRPKPVAEERSSKSSGGPFDFHAWSNDQVVIPSNALRNPPEPAPDKDKKPAPPKDKDKDKDKDDDEDASKKYDIAAFIRQLVAYLEENKVVDSKGKAKEDRRDIGSSLSVKQSEKKHHHSVKEPHEDIEEGETIRLKVDAEGNVIPPARRHTAAREIFGVQPETTSSSNNNSNNNNNQSNNEKLLVDIEGESKSEIGTTSESEGDSDSSSSAEGALLHKSQPQQE